MDEEGVDDDLKGGFADSIFPDDLDENFPGIPSGKDEDERREFIFNVILKCWKNPNINFDVSLPEIQKETFDKVDEKAIEDIKNMYDIIYIYICLYLSIILFTVLCYNVRYQSQCPAIFNQGILYYLYLIITYIYIYILYCSGMNTDGNLLSMLVIGKQV